MITEVGDASPIDDTWHENLPCLVKSRKTGTIFVVTHIDGLMATGIVLVAGNTRGKSGETSSHWDASDLILFKGAIKNKTECVPPWVRICREKEMK